MEGLVKIFEYVTYFYVVFFWVIAIIVVVTVVAVNYVVTWAIIENKSSMGWWAVAIIVYLGSFVIIQKMYDEYQHNKMCASNSETRYYRDKQGQLKVKEECINQRQKHKIEEYQKQHTAEYARNRAIVKKRAEEANRLKAKKNARLNLYFDEYQHDGKFDDYYDENFRDKDNFYEPRYDRNKKPGVD